MLIKEIELNNFRIYKDKNSVSILPTANKNIIVISGKNGFGKTTFLMALVWCLYGKQMEKVDALYQKEITDQGGYSKYIGNSLNRLAKSDGETSFSVSITFSNVKIPDISCKEIKITRSYDTHTGDGVEVLIDGMRNELIEDLATKNKQDGEEIFIRDFILPIEIAKFFFFDAEKIVSLAEISSPEQRRLLSKAYTEVLGIKKYEDLKDQLESIQDEYRKKSANPKEKTELNQIITDIQNQDIKLEEIQKKIDELNNERAEKAIESNDIQRKLIQEGNQITLEQLEQLKRDESKIEGDIAALQEDLKELYDLIPFGLAGETVLEVSSHLKYEKAVRDNKFQKDNIKEKTDQILDDVERAKKKFDSVIPTDIRNFYEEQIRILIKKHFYADDLELPSGFAVLHNFSDVEINDFNNTVISNLKHAFREKFETIHAKYVDAKSQLDSIRRNIRDAEKNAEDIYIKDLRDRKEALDKRIIAIDQELGNCNQDIGACKNETKTLKQRQEELRKKIDDSRNYGKKDKKAQEIIQRLKHFIKEFKEEKKKSLEKNILNELTTLMHKKGFIKKVVVDISQSGDDVDINLYNKRNEKIDKGSLSMGERQMYASSLLKALVDESDIEFPVFIDSPMQKFDKDHAKSIIKEFYPNVSDQVIIFPLIHKEITLSEFDLLKRNISKSYLIQNLDVDSSKFLSTIPEELFSTYDELENAG